MASAISSIIKNGSLSYTTTSWNYVDVLNSKKTSSSYTEWSTNLYIDPDSTTGGTGYTEIKVGSSDTEITFNGFTLKPGVEFNIKFDNFVDDTSFINNHSSYEFKGIILYLISGGSMLDEYTDNENCWLLLNKSDVQLQIVLPNYEYSYELCMMPVYVKIAGENNELVLQWASPIVVNRNPDTSENGHRFLSENGYSGYDCCENQMNILDLVSTPPLETGIYANNTDGTAINIETGEYIKVTKVPANAYLDTQNFGVSIAYGDDTEPIMGALSKDIPVISPNDTWLVEHTNYNAIEFTVDLNIDTDIHLYKDIIKLGNTPSYKFLGVCVFYLHGTFQSNNLYNQNDRCYFISVNNFEDSKATFKIYYNYSGDNRDGINYNESSSFGNLYLAPVFEAQREVYLTKPIIVNEFPDFLNIGKNGDNDFNITKGTTYNEFTDFGYTIGSIDVDLFRGNYVDTTTDQFNSKILGNAGFVELFGTWNGYDGDNWKQNMFSSSNAVDYGCNLKFNEIEYKEIDSSFPGRYTDLHSTYVNTAELDNDSLYLTISGSCSGLEGLGTASNEQTIQDRQIIHNGYEMIGFVVYFKNGSNDLDNIQNWPISNNITNEYSSYFVPLNWSYDDNANFSASIKIDFSGSDFDFTDENTLYNNLFENYLAISPVYLEVDKKTITIGEALDKDNNPLNVLTTDENYKFSCDNGNEYGYNETISVQSDDTLEFICELTNTEVIYDSTTNSYSQYTLERIEVVDTDGNLVKYSNDNNPSISISYEDFGDLDDLYIHPIYTFDTKDNETTKYKINNDTCREIELSIYDGDDEYNGSDYYINGNITNSITVKEWSDLDIAIYPKLPSNYSLKIIRIKDTTKDTNGWSSFKDSSDEEVVFDIKENGSIYDSIDDVDVINNIDYSADIYMKVSKQDLDVYHMSFLNGKLDFNTSVEDAVYVHCWSDKDDIKIDEPINTYVSDDLDDTAKKNLALCGVLPINYDFYSYSRNKTIKSINAETTHVINTSNNKCPENYPFINISLFPNTNESLYYIDKGSHFTDMYGETNPFIVIDNDVNHRWPDKEWEYDGNGVYFFIVDLSNFNTSDAVTFDYESYACGPLIGYINEREDDNTNAVILKENDFFIGVIEPGTDSVTVYGYDTVDSEQYLMIHNEDDIYNGPYIINITDGNILDSIREINYLGKDQIMPNDYCQYQTGNQYVMFRLRNPYNGKVLNYDDSYSYNTLTNAETANEALNDDYLNSTHEQTGFLTLWEQRSLFNALNGKPTYVNEVNEWAQLSEAQIESLDNKGTLTNTTITIGDDDTNPGNYVDSDSYWDKYVKSKFSGADTDLKNNTYFTINTKTRRKAGRALVDNIDDWFSWFKREEQPGIIANGNLDSPGGTPLCFAGPLLNEEYGCCINSDAVRSSTTLGPGESITIPIIVLYKTYEENGRDTASYSLGFDIRNNLYDSPLYYEVKFTAKYHSNVTDAVSSQKASIQESTKYNVTVR